MSLLRDIQNATIDANVDISVVLRKCKVLAARLGNEAFTKWVDRELNGYPDKNLLPDYRILRVNSKGHFAGPYGSGLKNGDIPLSCIPDKFREGLGKSYCMQPIAEYVSLLKSAGGTNFEEQWPPDLVIHVAGDIYEYMNLMTAWKVIPNPSIVGIVEAVRNRILNFVLEIENEAPDAGEAGPNSRPLSHEKVTQVFNTTIHGNVGNIAEGSQHVNQTAHISIVENDLESLKAFLSSIGMPGDEITNLEESISKDSLKEIKKTGSLGKKVLQWVGSITTKITKGTISLAQKVSVSLITKAILMYYGLD